MTLNSVYLVGRVGGDPDVRYFESGSMLCKLSLAVNRVGRNEERPDWFSLELWGKTADIAANYVRKGSLIGIEGSLKIDTWSDRATGAQRSSPRIRVNRMHLLGSKRDVDPNAVPGHDGGYDEF